jgi:putative spermidine/putrescine transport system permease protein
MTRRLLRDVVLAVVGLFLALPIVVVASMSFNQQDRLMFPPENPTFAWYGHFLDDAAWMGALENSLIVAAAAALVATAIALPVAYVLWRAGGRYVRALALLSGVPFMMPPVIMASGFLLFWGMLGHVGRLENTVLSHGVLFSALPLITISVGLAGIDRSLLDAAATMGARSREVFRGVVLPLVLPYVVCGFCFVLVLSLNEYIVAYFVAGFSVETLPIKMLNSLRGGFTPAMAVGSVFFLVAGLAVFGLIGTFGNLPKLLGADLRRD